MPSMKQILNTTILIFIIFIDASFCVKKLRKQSVVSQEDAVSWLNKYGYNPCLNTDAQCSLSFTSLIQDYQKRYKLKVTGKLDDATKQQMNRPRCGIKDKPVGELTVASLSSYKWSRSSLTYSIRGYPTQLSSTQTNNIIREAFQAWTDYVSLRIDPVCSTCPADFVIDFARETHSDNYPFDGSGGTLAHAFFPEDGRVHFDKDEPWTESFSNNDQINLYLVAVHEIGHALGLDHTYNDQSIMFPSYQPMPKSKILPQPDRDSIQRLYGKKQTGPGTTSSTRSTTTRSIVTTTRGVVTAPSRNSHPRCRMFIDAALNHPDGTLHTLNAGVLWRYLPSQGAWDARATSYQQTYPSLPSKLTGGVYDSRKRQIIFFSDKNVYYYDVDSENRAKYRSEKSLPRNLRNSISGAIYYLNQVYVITSRTMRLFKSDNGYQQSNQRNLSEEFPRFSGTVKKAFSYEGLHHFFTTDRLVYVWSERLNSWKTQAKPMETNWFACSATESAYSSSSYQDEDETAQNPYDRSSSRNRHHPYRHHHHHHHHHHDDD